MNQNPNFMKHVQLHERSWGDESYLDKPGLNEILAAPVVVFWKMLGKEKKRDEGRHRITLHDDLREVETLMSKLIFRSGIKPVDRKFVRGFVNGEEVRLRGVRLRFEKVIS